MKKYKSVWLIIAQTNLHVGDENLENIGIIDKMIQRDAITDIPCIHSSSLKGAVKEFIAYQNRNKEQDKKVDCQKIFGSDYFSKGNTQKGNTIFFDANLLALPVQSTEGELLFKLLYQEKELNLFTSRLAALGLEIDQHEIIKKIENELETVNKRGKVAEVKLLANAGESDLEGLDFKDICDDEHLPIIARNKLDTGENDGNLWYEQVLPAWSVMGTLICSDDQQLENALDGQIVQIGANATVGYGFCKFIKFMSYEKKQI